MAETAPVTLEDLQALAGPPDGDTLPASVSRQDPGEQMPEVIAYEDNQERSAEPVLPGAPEEQHRKAVRDEQALLERYRQQIEGWRQEAERQRQEAKQAQERLEQATAALLQAQQTPQAPQQPVHQQPLTLRDAFEAAWNGDSTKLEQYEARQQALEEARLRQQQQSQAEQARQAQLQGMAQALLQKYPELQQPEIQGKIGEKYAELETDPLMATLYRESTHTLPYNGKQYSIPLIVQAIQAYRAEQAQAGGGSQQASQGTPTVSQGQQTSRPRPAMVLPRGVSDLLKDPRVQGALEKNGWGKDLRTQQKKVWESLPTERREALLRQVER